MVGKVAPQLFRNCPSLLSELFLIRKASTFILFGASPS